MEELELLHEFPMLVILVLEVDLQALVRFHQSSILIGRRFRLGRDLRVPNLKLALLRTKRLDVDPELGLKPSMRCRGEIMLGRVDEDSSSNVLAQRDVRCCRVQEVKDCCGTRRGSGNRADERKF